MTPQEKLDRAVVLLQDWVCGNGDLQYVSEEQYQNLLKQSGEFLSIYLKDKHAAKS